MPQFDESSLMGDFAAILGADRVRIPQGLEAQATQVVIEPENSGEIAEVVRKCERDQIPLAPLGAARTLAQLNRVPIGVSLARMNRVIAYEPHDMTVVAEAGLTLGALNLIASSHGQRLPTDPPAPQLTTLGSLIAGAKAGPIRVSEGTIRDLLIGIRFVGHGGRIIHAGGQVVKNVAGYDLMKVMTGSFGTLGIIVEAACKMRPIPPGYQVAIAGFSTIRAAFEAVQACARAAALFHCDVLSPATAASLTERPFITPEGFILFAGFGGIRAEVEHQRAGLRSALGDNVRFLEESAAEIAYRALRDLSLDAAVAAQIAVRPAELARCLEGCDAGFRAHALSGVAQISQKGADDPVSTVANWRNLAHAAGGHLRVIAAPPELCSKLAIFDTPAPPAMALMRRLKASFDPHNIFNPGCFVGGL
jgi:glycolate oxidase FAD binding subunit